MFRAARWNLHVVVAVLVAMAWTSVVGAQERSRRLKFDPSRPAQKRWVEAPPPSPGTPEADLYQNYLKPRDWLEEE